MTLLSPIDDNCRGRFTTSRQSSIYPEDFEVQAVLAATFTHTTLPGASDYDGYSLFPEYSRIERLLITASECKDVAEELLEQAWERIIDALDSISDNVHSAKRTIKRFIRRQRPSHWLERITVFRTRIALRNRHCDAQMLSTRDEDYDPLVIGEDRRCRWKSAVEVRLEADIRAAIVEAQRLSGMSAEDSASLSDCESVLPDEELRLWYQRETERAFYGDGIVGGTQQLLHQEGVCAC